ncbi:MAG: DNA repair protein RecO [Clostridia bacterium]|nr:DNA repair protein RecO [Clostridia bacterium]
MEVITLNGVVLRETEIKENDKILTVATDALGKISVYCKGAKKINSKLSVGMGALSLLEMELKSGNDGMYILTGSRTAVDFSGITRDLEAYAYCNYILHVCDDLFLEDEPFPELFKLLLNTVYLYSQNKKNKELIKCTFELRSLFISGYAFDSDMCEDCGAEDKLSYIDLYNGGIYCEECGKQYECNKVSADIIKVIKHITYAEEKKLFSYSLPPELIKELSIISTNYIKICLEKRYSSLEYLRKIQKQLKG